MDMGLKIPLIGGQNTMDKGFDILWVGGLVSNIKCFQNTMGRGSIYHG
jgi:hypothetical protein